MINLFMVFIGGGTGAILRYLCNYFFMDSLSYWATFAINILGSLFMGLASGLFFHYTSIPSEIKLLLVTGVLGGFTTFSAFQFELLTLIQDGNYKNALIYGGLSLIVGLLAAFLGMMQAYYIIK